MVFGGHDSWAKAIKPLLNGVKFVDRGSRPDRNLMRYADVVWVQSNAIAHKDYYVIADIVRVHNKRLEYFSFASAEKCAAELAKVDISMSDEADAGDNVL